MKRDRPATEGGASGTGDQSAEKRARVDDSAPSTSEVIDLPPLDAESVRARVQATLGPFVSQLFSEEEPGSASEGTAPATYSEDVQEFLGFVASIATEAASKLHSLAAEDTDALASAETAFVQSVVSEFGEVIGEDES